MMMVVKLTPLEACLSSEVQTLIREKDVIIVIAPPLRGCLFLLDECRREEGLQVVVDTETRVQGSEDAGPQRVPGAVPA